MKNFYISVEPYPHEGFMKIFDLADESGDIGYFIERYDGSEIKPEDLAKAMSVAKYHIFGFSIHVPELVDKMKIEIVKQDDKNFLLFNLAPFLGLPSDNVMEELKEFKGFLEWVKK